MARVSILGAGVVGLFSAHALAHAGHQVGITSSVSPSETTSAVAGASFKPHLVTRDATTASLLSRSRAMLDRWDATGFGRALGIRRHVHLEASSEAPLDRWYLDVMDDVEHLRLDDGDQIPGDYPFALRYGTYLFDVPKVIEGLVNHLSEDHGVTIEIAHVTSLAELDAAGDVTVNATGMGAQLLCNDQELVPVQGQTLVVATGGLPRDWSMSADGHYFYPRSTGTLLGGTTVHGATSLEPSAAVSAAFLRGNARVLPALASLDSSHGAASVGLRPYRQIGIRLEFEARVGATPLVHAYGHGGSGWTLAPATAAWVVEAVAQTGV